MVAAVLLVFAAGAAVLAVGALSSVFAEYRDSTRWTYLEIGLPTLALALAAVWAAIRLWRGR